jgi:hypothetical protein
MIIKYNIIVYCLWIDQIGLDMSRMKYDQVRSDGNSMHMHIC